MADVQHSQQHDRLHLDAMLPSPPFYEIIPESDFVRDLTMLLLASTAHPSRTHIRQPAKRPRMTRTASGTTVKRTRQNKSGARHASRHSDSHIIPPLSPIDALASVAAQVQQPTSGNVPRSSQGHASSPGGPSFYTWQAVVPGMSPSQAERPAKRARSEVWPSPQITSPALQSRPIRPITSYSTTLSWGYDLEKAIDSGQRVGYRSSQVLPGSGGIEPPPRSNEQRLSDAELLLGFSRAASSATRTPKEDSQSFRDQRPGSMREPALPPFPYSAPAEKLHTITERAAFSLSPQMRSVQNSRDIRHASRPSQTQTPPEDEAQRKLPLDPAHVSEAEVDEGDDRKPIHPGPLTDMQQGVGLNISMEEQNEISDRTLRVEDLSQADFLNTPQSLLATDTKDPPSPNEPIPSMEPQRLNSVTKSEDRSPPPQKPNLEDVLAMLGNKDEGSNIEPFIEAITPVEASPIVASQATIKQAERGRKRKHEITKCAACAWEHNSFPSGEFVNWLQCNGCKQWFHLQCAGFTLKEIRKVDKYYCTQCRAKFGKTTFVRKSARTTTSVDYAGLNEGVLRLSDESPEHHYIKPIKEGTITFQPETFPRMQPEELTADFFEGCPNFTEPIIIPAILNPPRYRHREVQTQSDRSAGPAPEDVDGAVDIPIDEGDSSTYEQEMVVDEGQDRLDMVIPRGLTVRKVAELHGAEMPVEVIDVKNQEGDGSKKWTVGKWADYYESTGEKVIRNVISLEVSRSPLGRLIRRPQVVRDLDLQDSVWPATDDKRVSVGFYCLMSVADSYTDFHIDFGGSSVFYHIVKGKKTFFFIPPTKSNLKKYEDWCRNRAQASIFLPDSTKECYRVDLSPGDTMMIPAGWIHAVWTPEDSLVIGGNFLTRLHYSMQFQIAEIERNCKVGAKFKYPYYQKVMWYAIAQYLEEDPIPEDVRRLIYNGNIFERQTPSFLQTQEWGHNSIASPAKFHARYYPKAELDGLPDLVSYIFRTVMIYLDRLDGTSQDVRKAVSRSIPRKAGEPVRAAKDFALWAAWKRGNEHLPLWAHPNGKGLSPPPADTQSVEKIKRCSAAEMKKLEKLAPVMNFVAPPSSPEPQPKVEQEEIEEVIDVEVGLEDLQMPENLDDNGIPDIDGSEFVIVDGHAISTPKTSVLGPRRTACDVCRKRKMRCKHMGDSSGTAASVSGGESPTSTSGHHQIVPSPFPEQEAFVSSQSREVALVQDEGLDSKKLRNKACSECRRSKRRCIHDEHGNVDPVKQAEPVVPRGAAIGRKRKSSSAANGDPVNKKIKGEGETHGFVFEQMYNPHVVLQASQNFSDSRDDDIMNAPVAPMATMSVTTLQSRQGPYTDMEAALSTFPRSHHHNLHDSEAQLNLQRGPNGVGSIVASVQSLRGNPRPEGDADLLDQYLDLDRQHTEPIQLQQIDPALQAFIDGTTSHFEEPSEAVSPMEKLAVNPSDDPEPSPHESTAITRSLQATESPHTAIERSFTSSGEQDAASNVQIEPVEVAPLTNGSSSGHNGAELVPRPANLSSSHSAEPMEDVRATDTRMNGNAGARVFALEELNLAADGSARKEVKSVDATPEAELGLKLDTGVASSS